MPPDVTILPFTGVSDGNSRNWPERGLRNENPQIYLTKLASKYAKDTNLAGSKFTLSQLPNGYALFGKTRAKEPTHVDRYLYGHDRYAYRSVEEFYPHFFRLMSRSSFDDCPCRACKKGNYTPRQSGPKTQAPKQPKPAESSQIAQQKVPNRPASGASAPAIITKPGQQPFLRAFPTINGAKASSPLTEGRECYHSYAPDTLLTLHQLCHHYLQMSVARRDLCLMAARTTKRVPKTSIVH